MSYFKNILFTVGKQTPCMLSFAYTSSACVLIRKGYFSDKQVNAFRISYIISGHVLHKPYHMRNKVRFMKLCPFSSSSLWFEITPKDFFMKTNVIPSTEHNYFMQISCFSKNTNPCGHFVLEFELIVETLTFIFPFP